MSPIMILTSVWLMVIGYGLIYVGYKNLGGTKVSFSDAFFPKGLFGQGGPGIVPGQGGPASGNQNTNPIQGRSSGTQAFA